MSNVREGQIWIDNDKRHKVTRHVRIEAIYDGKAKCWSYYNNEVLGRYVWIRLDRFKENATGYRLERDADTPAARELVKDFGN